MTEGRSVAGAGAAAHRERKGHMEGQLDVGLLSFAALWGDKALAPQSSRPLQYCLMSVLAATTREAGPRVPSGWVILGRLCIAYSSDCSERFWPHMIVTQRY